MTIILYFLVTKICFSVLIYVIKYDSVISFCCETSLSKYSSAFHTFTFCTCLVWLPKTNSFKNLLFVKLCLYSALKFWLSHLYTSSFSCHIFLFPVITFFLSMVLKLHKQDKPYIIIHSITGIIAFGITMVIFAYDVGSKSSISFFEDKLIFYFCTSFSTVLCTCIILSLSLISTFILFHSLKNTSIRII